MKKVKMGKILGIVSLVAMAVATELMHQKEIKDTVNEVLAEKEENSEES